METEIQTIERLMREGSSVEELSKKYPKYIDHIKLYREFLDNQSKPNKKETYLVIVAETVSKKYYIEATSEEEAEDKVFTPEILFDPDEEECVEREISYLEVY